jgi:hypothetical protein
MNIALIFKASKNWKFVTDDYREENLGFTTGRDNRIPELHGGNSNNTAHWN